MWSVVNIWCLLSALLVPTLILHLFRFNRVCITCLKLLIEQKERKTSQYSFPYTCLRDCPHWNAGSHSVLLAHLIEQYIHQKLDTEEYNEGNEAVRSSVQVD